MSLYICLFSKNIFNFLKKLHEEKERKKKNFTRHWDPVLAYQIKFLAHTHTYEPELINYNEKSNCNRPPDTWENNTRIDRPKPCM